MIWPQVQTKKKAVCWALAGALTTDDCQNVHNLGRMPVNAPFNPGSPVSTDLDPFDRLARDRDKLLSEALRNDDKATSRRTRFHLDQLASFEAVTMVLRVWTRGEVNSWERHT